MRKFIGILLLFFGVILILVLLGRLMSFLSSIIRLTQIFSSELTGFERGQITGGFVYWVIHITLIYFSLRYGSKYLKKKVGKTENTGV